MILILIHENNMYKTDIYGYSSRRRLLKSITFDKKQVIKLFSYSINMFGLLIIKLLDVKMSH